MPTYPQRLKSSYITVLVGNGASPEIFTKICGGTSKSFNYQKNTTDDILDDCENPEAIPSRNLQVTSRQFSITLNALYNRTQAALIRSLTTASTSSNMRFEFLEPATGAKIDEGYWAGAAMVTSFQVTAGGNAEYGTCVIQIESDGEFGWIDGLLPAGVLTFSNNDPLQFSDGRYLELAA